MKPYIILDTNVLISALMYPWSASSRCVVSAFRYFQPVVSSETWDEFELVSSRTKFAKFYTSEERANFVLMLAQSIKLIEVSHAVEDCRNPKDNRFLNLALSSQCEIIVSGDRDLCDMSPYRGIRIITPTDFLQLFDTSN